MPIPWATIIPALTSLAGSVMANRGQSGSVERKPAPMSPDMEQMVSNFFSGYFGEDESPGMDEMMSADDIAQREAYGKYFGATDPMAESLRKTIFGMAGRLNDASGYLQSAFKNAMPYIENTELQDAARKAETYMNPLDLSIGGQKMSFVPGASRRTATDIFGRGRDLGASERTKGIDIFGMGKDMFEGERSTSKDLLDMALKEYGVGKDQAGEHLGYETTFTPYKAARDYTNDMWDKARQFMGMSYRIPTESASTSTNWGALLSDIGKYSQPLLTEILKGLQQNAPGAGQLVGGLD